MASLVNSYANPDSAGGNGTTDAITGVNAAYISQASFITNEGKDISLATGSDEKFVINCANEGTGTVDTSRANYLTSAFTTDAANDNIISIVGEIDPLNLNTTDYYSIDANDDSNGSIEIDVDVDIDKLQIQNGGVTDCQGVYFPGTSSLTCHITNCIIEGMSGNGINIGNGQPDTSTIYIQNNVIANVGTRGINVNDPYLRITNNTITGCVVGLYDFSYVAGTADFYIANNLIVNNTTDYGHISWSSNIIHDFNADSDGTLNSNETNGVENATVAFASATNWHIDNTGESELIGAGAGPTNAIYGAYVLTADPDGDARSGTTTDIGADEIPVAGGNENPWYYYAQMAAQ